MANITRFKHKKRICLSHYGECYFSGIDSAGNIYCEEYYENGYIAQYCITKQGVIITTVDEDSGKNDIKFIDLPEDIIPPSHPLEHPLNFTGLRYRGMREQEKVMEWVKPLAVMEKMPLIQALKLTISPMMIFGIAESRVLAETEFSDDEVLVCRRIRLLRALPEIQHDEQGLPYDYDTVTFHVLHTYNDETESVPPLHEAINYFPELSHPMDCMIHDDQLIVANGSDGENPCEVHLFQLQENPPQE